MPELAFSIIKGDKVSDKTDYRDALPVNMYAVRRDLLGSPGYMLCYPGLTKIAEGAGVDRGGNYNERFVTQYRVSGRSLVEVNADLTTTVLGVVPGLSQASMPYSFNTQCIIADGRMFLHDNTLGFREVTDTDLGDPIDGVWVDGYYFLTDGEYLYHTDITDESSIDPLKFATAEFMPDPSLAVAKTQDNKVLVFGRYSLEYFVDTATENFAFSRVVTRAQKIGIVATHAKCEVEGNWFITGGRKGESLGVHVIGTGQALRVSTREIDRVLEQYTEPQLANMRMESRADKGVSFVLIHLPNETLCYNASIAKELGSAVAWSILKTDVEGDAVYRGINGVFDARFGYWVYGDKLNGNLGRLDDSVFTHYDEMVEWLLFTPFLHLENASINEIEIETIPGNTTTDDATVAFSLTTDGRTYSKEWWAMYGEQNDYGQRFIIRRVGHIRDWVGFKFRGATKSRMSFAQVKVDYG